MNLFQKLYVITEAGLSAMVSGDPGIGKTSIGYQLGKALNIHAKCIIASLYETEHFSGVPHLKDGELIYSDPELFKEFKDLTEGLIMFDEINTSNRKIQNVLLRVILEGVAGPMTLHEGIRMIACGNYTNVAGNIQMSLALCNRFVHVFQEADAEEWSQGILSGFIAPELPTIDPEWREKYIPRYTALLSAYIKANPNALMVMPETIDEDPRMNAWPSPRTWEFAIKILAITHGMEVSERQELIKGTIGIDQTDLLFKYLRDHDLINIDEIDINDIKIPNNPAIADVMLRSLVYYAKHAKYAKLAICVFNKAKSSGLGSLVMANAKPLAAQLKLHYSVPEIIKEMPYVGEILKKV